MNTGKRLSLGLDSCKRIVVKIGTSVLLSRDREFNMELVRGIVGELCEIRHRGKDVVLVTSGAIGTGANRLGLKVLPQTIPLKQAAAAVGQSHLMQIYEGLFSEFGQKIAQILVTHWDLEMRKSFLNFYNTIRTLFDRNVIPIINENDSVAVQEIKFGDNDTLSAVVAHSIEADILIVLSDVDGLMKGFKGGQGGEVIPVIKEVSSELRRLVRKEKAGPTIGGMSTKLQAAEIVTRCGIPMVIANGTRSGVIHGILEGQEIGTMFLPRKGKMTSRKRWIAFNLNSCGEVMVDKGAKAAIVSRGKSLLPSGILEVSGQFEAGDAVTVVGDMHEKFAKGLTNYSRDEIDKIKGRQTKGIEEVLGYKYFDEVIHRDNLVLLD